MNLKTTVCPLKQNWEENPKIEMPALVCESVPQLELQFILGFNSRINQDCY